MAIKPLRFHPEAEEEYSWYRGRSPVAGINFESAIEDAAERIWDAPRRWPIYFGNFRKYVLRQFPFSIIYQEFPSKIVIFAVAHGSRNPGYWKERA